MWLYCKVLLEFCYWEYVSLAGWCVTRNFELLIVWFTCYCNGFFTIQARYWWAYKRVCRGMSITVLYSLVVGYNCWKLVFLHCLFIPTCFILCWINFLSHGLYLHNKLHYVLCLSCTYCSRLVLVYLEFTLYFALATSNKFVSVQGELQSFSDMKRLWLERKFSYIFEAQPSTSVIIFMQILYSHTISNVPFDSFSCFVV